jgi:hypothetical protein
LRVLQFPPFLWMMLLFRRSPIEMVDEYISLWG